MSFIELRTDNGVLEVQFNRPDKKNAITEQMYKDLNAAFVSARQDDSIKAILIHGQRTCFTAGNDLKDFLSHPPVDSESSVFQFLLTMADFPKPVVAAVNGPAIGIGTTLLLHCDLVYCGEGAVFQLPFVNLGLVPEFASSYLLPLRVGHVKASEWLLSGKKFGAQEAKEAGLVNEVYNDEQFFSVALHQALQLAKQPSQSIQITKRLMKQTYMAKTLQTLEEEGEIFRQRLSSDDFKNAVGQFLNR